MDLKKHYDNLYKNTLQKITKDDYLLDDQILNPADTRRGITLIIRPSQEVKENIQLFLNEIKTIEPNQYYYPNSDIHITVLSIISCEPDFNLNSIHIPDYIKVIKESLLKIEDLEINFQGITASPSAIMIQGFTNLNILDSIRTKLRSNFHNSRLQQSIDQRYSIATAHTTVMRFQNKFKNKELLLEKIEKYRNFNFGTFKPNSIELVYNDWYQKVENVKTIQLFKI